MVGTGVQDSSPSQIFQENEETSCTAALGCPVLQLGVGMFVKMDIFRPISDCSPDIDGQKHDKSQGDTTLEERDTKKQQQKKEKAQVSTKNAI